LKALLAACLVAAAAGGACARDRSGCAPEVEDTLRELNPKRAIAGEVADAQCKPWPGSQLLAAVMAFERGESPDRHWTAVLALLDGKTLRVKHSQRFEIEEDAINRVGPGSFRLDTANYALAPGVRALGLRYDHFGPGPSAADGSQGDELILFVPDGRKLRPVLGTAMARSRAITGCLRSCPDAIIETADFTLAIGPRGPSGWNDLLLSATVRRDGPDDDKTIDRTPKRLQQVYRHDGREYKLLSTALDWDDFCCTVGWPPR
jgi:hypothetical protein